jgi:hypothetical protein
VFPRKNFRDRFLRGGPVGCIGAGNGIGWMLGEEFLTSIKHFTKHAKPTKDNKVLLLLDNHESHLYWPTIDFCRENDIILLSFPPHGPFKRFVNSAMDSWIKSHPVTGMTIYSIPEIVAIYLPQAATSNNILSGFSATEIWPFDPNVFEDSDFVPCKVTDRTNKNLRNCVPSSGCSGTSLPHSYCCSTSSSSIQQQDHRSD